MSQVFQKISEKIRIQHILNTVVITLECRDAYEAAALFDETYDALSSKRGLTLRAGIDA